MEKRITENEIVIVTSVKMSVTCHVTAVLEISFPNFNLTSKENFSGSLFILMDIFG